MFLESFFLLVDKIGEKLLVLVADGEMQMCLMVCGGIKCGFYEVFFDGRSWSVGIAVEEEHALWLLSVAESVGVKEYCDYVFILSVGDELWYVLAMDALTGVAELLIECESVDVLEEVLLERCGGCVVGCTEECEEVFEHA